jgi:hypothetical protein
MELRICGGRGSERERERARRLPLALSFFDCFFCEARGKKEKTLFSFLPTEARKARFPVDARSKLYQKRERESWSREERERGGREERERERQDSERAKRGKGQRARSKCRSPALP